MGHGKIGFGVGLLVVSTTDFLTTNTIPAKLGKSCHSGQAFGFVFLGRRHMCIHVLFFYRVRLHFISI